MKRPPWYGSRYTGLFAELGAIAAQPYDPQLPMWSATLPPCGPRHEPLTLGGAGYNDAAAEGACVGEAIERLRPYRLPRDQVVHASHAAFPLAEEALAPDSVVLFHPQQYAQPGFPFVPFTPELACPWLLFRRADSGEPCWVPADLGYLYVPEGSHALCPSVSTGLSCGEARGAVLLRGVQEVIERDAVVGAWWGRYPVEEWDETAALRSRLARPNLRCRCYRIQTPYSQHVTIVTLQGETHGGFCFSIGSACRERRADSFRKAALEAVQGLHFVRYLKQEITAGRRPWTGELRDFPDHAVYYSLHPERLTATVLNHATAPHAPEPERHEGLAALRERLGPRHPVLFRLMTPPELFAQVPELCVVRVVIPGLQPLHGSQHFPHLGGPLWAPRGLREFAALPPHPFP